MNLARGYGRARGYGEHHSCSGELEPAENPEAGYGLQHPGSMLTQEKKLINTLNNKFAFFTNKVQSLE